MIALLALVSACSRDPRIEERSIVVYSPRSCPIAESAAYSVIYAGGDFEPRPEAPPTAELFLREHGKTMDGLPPKTRSLVIDISEPGRSVAWVGKRIIPDSGPINVLAWPRTETCRLSRDVERRTEMAFGVFDHHFLVVGGKSADGGQVPHTFVGDLTTGIIERLDIGLGTRRSRPSITRFALPEDGDGPAPALVAGGHNPDSETVLDTAELYMPPTNGATIGEFEGTRITLNEPRTEHGAVVLATGETLLVGGVGPGGPLGTMEIVDPKTRRSRNGGVRTLAVARARPTVLRLASGEILVAGGVDARGRPVPTLEWFSPDATQPVKQKVDLVPGRERAFVALDGGGALAVIIPEGSAPDFKTVWVISAEGTVEPGLPIDPTTLETVRLFAGEDGSPVLWTGRRWMRWQPWFGAFQPIGGAPSIGPGSEAIANGDRGLALWLEDRGGAGMNVTGYSFGWRTPYDAVPKPLLINGPDELVPDRLAGFPGSSIRFELERGLVMGPGASAFLADVTFADFTLDVDVTASAPSIVLRDEAGRELEVGGAACAFAQAAMKHLQVIRTGARVRVALDGGETRDCPAELARGRRVSIGLRGGQGSGISAARNLLVVRR
jgi:hypothetical protein